MYLLMNIDLSPQSGWDLRNQLCFDATRAIVPKFRVGIRIEGTALTFRVKRARQNRVLYSGGQHRSSCRVVGANMMRFLETDSGERAGTFVLDSNILQGRGTY